MADEQDEHTRDDFVRKIRSKERRKKRAREEGDRSIWFGLGMFGLVGWSVAIPTLIALAIGIWIDSRYESEYSWTLMLLVVGIALGCWNAWYWVRSESRRDGG